jgi:phytoene dehydrogenase-like protein
MNETHVVGAGPNGLAAAIVLQRAGSSVTVHERAANVGGAARSEEVTLPGFVHDIGAAVHPLGAASPLFRSLPLADHGLGWVHPDLLLAHPLDGGTAAALHRSLDATCAGLGADGDAYRRLVGRIVDRWDDLEDGVLGPIIRLPRHPVELTRFGIVAIQPARWIMRRFETDAGKALFAGLAAHTPMPLNHFATSAIALVLAACGHRNGWPFAAGGSQTIANSLASYFESIGGKIETGHEVTDIAELGDNTTVLFDTDVRAALAIAGGRVSPRLRRRLGNHRHGPGLCKVDYALSAPAPWDAASCRSAGTIHIGGSAAEIAAAERDVSTGRNPVRPFVIAAQPSRFDDSRAPDGRHVLWAYTRVPAGSNADVSAAIDRQIERFAPGFGKLVMERHVTTAADLEKWDPNLVGGDIAGGRTDRLRMIFRPRLAFDPYRIGDGLYLCSSVTPPGPGVHGMAGYHAARSVLRAGRDR